MGDVKIELKQAYQRRGAYFETLVIDGQAALRSLGGVTAESLLQELRLRGLLDGCIIEIVREDP